MTVKTILTEPNQLLREISQPVDQVGENEQKLMDDMIETMYAANGIGLAAIQIGFPKRIIVMDISKDKKNKNPISSLLFFSSEDIVSKIPAETDTLPGIGSTPVNALIRETTTRFDFIRFTMN